MARKAAAQEIGELPGKGIYIEEPEVFMSLVVPAYNEDERLGIMLTEAVTYLQDTYDKPETKPQANGVVKKRKDAQESLGNGHASPDSAPTPSGWEVLVVSDGSTDNTIDTALQFARDLGGEAASSIRVITLRENRGKGGAVTHGMRHVRGQYAIFADADGASKFEDLGKLVRESRKIEDAQGRGVAVGSRAHLVGSEAVVKVRTVLHHSHDKLALLTILSQALLPPQPPHALLPPPPPPPHPSRHRRDLRHAVRLQALLARLAPVHHPIHAFRGLDLRRRDADAGRVCGDTRCRSPRRLEGGQGQ